MFRFTMTLPGYISLRSDDATNVVILKNAKYLLVKSAIPKGVHIMVDILPNLKKLTLADHDLQKFPEL